MAGAFGGGGGDVTVGTRYNSLRMQSSEQGLPIPLIYGTCKAPGNLIWYGDFTVHEHTEEVGKGGGGSEVTSYTYSCAVAIGLCEGEIDGIGNVYKNQEKASLSELNFNVFTGTSSQQAWSHLTTKHPGEALRYPDTAYAASSRLDLASSNYLPQLWFEVRGKLRDTGVLDGSACPAEMIEDFLTNDRYGCLWPAAKVDTESLKTSNSSLKQYAGVNGIAFSALVNERKPARQYISEWLEVLNTAPVWSENKIKFRPYGDIDMTGHGYAFTTEKTIQYALTAGDFLCEPGEEPVEITRSDPNDAYNNVRLRIRESANNYNTAVVEVKDQASIEAIGLRPRELVNAEFIPDPAAGKMAAELIKNRGLYNRNHYRFRLSWEYALLEPMDKVSITLPDQGLDAVPVTIIEICEDDAGYLEILAEEFLEGSQWSVQYPTEKGQGYAGQIMQVPSDVNEPVMFEPRVAQRGISNPAIWAVVTGDPDTWGGARVWISTDGGSNYKSAGFVEKGGITGVLTAGLAADGTTVAVNLSECRGLLASVTAEEAGLGRTAMKIGNEILAYTTATLTGENTYNLTGLVRGLFGTAAEEHSASDRLGYLGATIHKQVIPNESWYGVTLKLKFTSVNAYASREQSLEDVTEYTYSITGAGNESVVPSIGDIPDVDLTDVEGGDTLVWDPEEEKFVPGDSAGVTEISRLEEKIGELGGTEQFMIDQLSGTVLMTATTISATASSRTFSDSAEQFIAKGFEEGDLINVSGFSTATGNNIFSGKIESLTAGDMVIEAPEGDDMEDAVAGDEITITKRVTRRIAANEVGGGGGISSSAGTFTARIFDATTGGNESSTTGEGEWVRIGDLVWIRITFDAAISISGMMTGNNAYIRGHGFTTGTKAPLSALFNNYNIPTGDYQVTPIMLPDGNIVFADHNDAGAAYYGNVSQISGATMNISGCFKLSAS